jgi:signal peptidase II
LESLLLKKWSPFVGIVAFILILDQISKTWVLENLRMGETIVPLPFLHPYLQITRSSNTGAAFGIFPDAPEILLVLSVVITVGILYFYWRSENHAHLQHVALSLVVGGALGNVIDRFQHGAVVDFVHFRIPGVISNVSNFADHAIVIGVILLFIDSVLAERRAHQAKITTADAPHNSLSDPPQEITDKP